MIEVRELKSGLVVGYDTELNGYCNLPEELMEEEAPIEEETLIKTKGKANGNV